MTSEICSKCGSDKIVPRAKAIDRGDYNAETNLCVAIDANPDALIFKERTRANLYAKVCGDCGFIEFYAENPSGFYEIYQSRERQS